MTTLNWQQVTAWRLARHNLLMRVERTHMLDTVRQIGGLQAQMMSAAELQLWARVERITPSDVQAALWTDRTLVKMWAMRGTLHLIDARDLPLLVAALSTLKHFRRASWQKYHGVSSEELDAIIAGVRDTLNAEGMTREQLANAIAVHTHLPKLAELLRSGWGGLLKPVAFQGYLCFGASQGQNVTFVQPQHWLGAWTPLDPDDALKDVARRFLGAYGPATIDEFDRWFGLEPSAARRVFRSLGDELVEVEVEGWKAWALAASLPEIESASALRVVRLLPNFDPYTIAVAPHSQYLLAPEHKPRVYRPQGWISPVVLVDGRIEGVWEYDTTRAGIIVKLDLFAPPDAALKDGIEAEAQRLGLFFGADVQTVYS
jgi:hypothetical protein